MRSSEGYISVTPLKSDMTDHQALATIDSWNYLNDTEELQKTSFGKLRACMRACGQGH